MYVRMTFSAAEVYEILEPLLKDFRKLRLRNMMGYSLTYMDEFVHALLTEERVCDIILPRIAKRQVLEEAGELGPRKSLLLDAMEKLSDQESDRSSDRRMSESRSSSGGRSRSRTPNSRGSPQYDGYVSRSPSRSPASYQSRSHSISPDRACI